jgi:hypothetical protein
VHFAPTYTSWAQTLKGAAPNVSAYALDLSAVEPRQASSYNSLFPKAPLPRFVPAMSLSGNRDTPRIMWEDRDGEKSAKGLSAFLLNNSKHLTDRNIADISGAFGLTRKVAQLEGGSVHKTKKNTMARSPTRKSPHRKHKSPHKRKSPHKAGIMKWAEAMKRARRELGIVGFEKVKKGSRLYSATKRIYEKM